MAGARIYSRKGTRIGFNMTPMIDCTFQLIIFFMLTTQMASADFVPMKLPEPQEPAVKELKENKAVLNVVGYSDGEITANPSRRGMAKWYSVKQRKVSQGDLGRLVQELKLLNVKSVDPDNFAVEVRADRRLRYDQVQIAMQALQQAGLRNMRLAVLGTRRQGE
jgi:biopolymer transport protein ExbD